MSKERAGPATVLTSSRQAAPAPRHRAQLASTVHALVKSLTHLPVVVLHRSVVKHGVPGLVPPVQTPGSSDCGRGNGVKSTSATGIGLELFGFELAVKPEKPVSSPEMTFGFWANDWSGSSSVPKVRWEMLLIGLIPASY